MDFARPFLVSPAVKIEIENSLGMALSKAKSGGAWQSHFWQCGTLRAARDTKLFALRKWIFERKVQHVDVCVILPAFCGFIVSGELLKQLGAFCGFIVSGELLKQLGAFRASCRNPMVSPAIKIEVENSLGMALSKVKSGSVWQSHFLQLRETQSSSHYASGSKLGLFEQQAFNATGRTTSWSRKSQCVCGT